MTENKRIRTCHKYHYDTVKICRETDVIFTRCRVCKNLFPSTLEYFRKDTTKDSQRMIQPLCIKCARELEKQERARAKEKERELTREAVHEIVENWKKLDEKRRIKNVEQKELFDWKIFTKEESESNETLESKINKIFNFLWLK